MHTFTRAQLITALRKKTGLPEPMGHRIVGLILESMTEALKRGESADVPGIGTLVPRRSKRLSARNPKTGETLKLEPKVIPVLKVCGEMRQRLEDARRARRWFTIAYFNPKGFLCPTHQNFRQTECSIDTVLENLSRQMREVPLGAHMAMLWEGQLGRGEALGPRNIPTHVVYAGGAIEKLKLQIPLNHPRENHG
jgi:integration host factor subunit beta